MAKRAPKPGDFVYHGGMVFEIDDQGKERPRKDLGPDYKGNFKHKYYTGKKVESAIRLQVLVERKRVKRKRKGPRGDPAKMRAKMMTSLVALQTIVRQAVINAQNHEDEEVERAFRRMMKEMGRTRAYLKLAKG